MADPILSKLQVLKPSNALSMSFRENVKGTSLVPLIKLLPCIIPTNYVKKIQLIDDQWRRLPLSIAQLPENIEDEKEIDVFWYIVLKTCYLVLEVKNFMFL